MKATSMRSIGPLHVLAVACVWSGATACGSDEVEVPETVVTSVALQRAWKGGEEGSPVFADCLYASPLRYDRDGSSEIIVAAADVIAGISPETGELLWSVDLPEPEGRRAFAAATPVIVDDLLVVGYQVWLSDEAGNSLDEGVDGLGAADARDGHYVAVIDLSTRALSQEYPALRMEATLPGNGGDVSFRAANQFGRGDLQWAPGEDGTLGHVYVTYGNVRDIQPWHGWAFDISLDAWRTDPSTAIQSVLVTTPETDCGTSGVSGSTQRICGGGLWAPSGPLVVEHDDTHSLVLAPANGQLDLARNDFANTLMRVAPGLAFEHGCDADACADFDVDAPSRECIESCQNLFIPRPLPGEGPPAPASGICDGLEFFECWQQLDYIGGSTPVFIEVDEWKLLAYPTKDGHVYLVDFDNMGQMHDRIQLVEYCGTEDDVCIWSWAGMIVTQPAVLSVDGEARLVIPTFMPDSTHPAGVVSVAVVSTDDGPRFQRRWEYPNFSSDEAVASFRAHPSRAVVHPFGDQQLVLLTEPDLGGIGRILALDGASGVLQAATPLAGSGYRFTRPLVIGDRVFVNSCTSDRGPGTLEAYDIVRVEPED
jgi:hypothetical protein